MFLLSVAYFSFKLQNEALDLEGSNDNNSDLCRWPGTHILMSRIRSEEREDAEPTLDNLEINEYATLNPGTRSWEVERENIIIKKIIGDSSFGQVAQGTATSLPEREGRITVAIKMLYGILLTLYLKRHLSNI